MADIGMSSFIFTFNLSFDFKYFTQKCIYCIYKEEKWFIIFFVVNEFVEILLYLNIII